jgi:hypothetical protein
MSNDRKSASTPSKEEISKVLSDAWTEAARINPMLLAKLSQDYDFDRLRQMITDCLAKGLSALETRKHIVDELLRSARNNEQPHASCDDTKAEPEQKEFRQ